MNRQNHRGSRPWTGMSMCGVAVLVAACAASSPAPVLLTLPPAAGLAAAPAASAAASVPVLAVRRVSVPEYLSARRVRYRSESSTLAEWPNTYWAERIEIGVSREFVSALRLRLPDWSLCDTNCGDQVPTLTLQIDLVPMDFIRPARKLQARAHIAVSSGAATPTILQTREINYELPATADTPQGQAEAIGALLRQLAADTAPIVKSARL